MIENKFPTSITHTLSLELKKNETVSYGNDRERDRILLEVLVVVENWTRASSGNSIIFNGQQSSCEEGKREIPHADILKKEPDACIFEIYTHTHGICSSR